MVFRQRAVTRGMGGHARGAEDEIFDL
jgi:hypothetical protein